MTADDIIAARRARIIEVVDARGRTIGVRRIRPSEQLFAIELAEDGDALIGLLCAAAVTFIEEDGARRTTPSDIREPVLWSIIGSLGADGLAAVTYAVWQHAAGPAVGPPSFQPFRPFASMALPDLNEPKKTTVMTSPRKIGTLTFAPETILPAFSKV